MGRRLSRQPNRPLKSFTRFPWLTADILEANRATGGDFQINFTQSIVESANEPIDLHSGVTLVIDGGNPTQGVGDFNGDGQSDILWRNSETGEVLDWTIRDNRRVHTSDIGSLTTGEAIVGVGDFTGDGVDDILIKNGKRELTVWRMDNGKLAGQTHLGAPSTGWTYVGAGDFRGDGTDDLLFKTASGALDVWTMTNGERTGGFSLGAVVPTGFSVAAIGDFTSNRFSDLLIEDARTGAVEVGLVNADHTIAGWTSLGSPMSPSTWRFAA